VLSSSKYLTNPAPVGGNEFLSFLAIISPLFKIKCNESIIVIYNSIHL
jgi:hypothetical protein